MTQDEKDILLKDLCARVPYGVKARGKIPINQNESKEIVGQVTCVLYNINIVQMGGFDVIIDYNPYFEIKPYLFPLSSMDLDQRIEYSRTLVIFDESHCSQTHETYDWFNKNHFDYRGLIEKGLAIDATGLDIY